MAFSNLTDTENQLLKEAPALIAVLIGAADGRLDREERTWAEKLVEARAYARPESLQDFYKAVAVGFWERMQSLLESLPGDAGERNSLISNKLAALNPIMAKLEPFDGAAIYRSFKMLAEEVAKASGGFLRIGAVSAAEHQWVGLPMLTPIFSEALKTSLGSEWRAEDEAKDA